MLHNSVTIYQITLKSVTGKWVIFLKTLIQVLTYIAVFKFVHPSPKDDTYNLLHKMQNSLKLSLSYISIRKTWISYQQYTQKGRQQAAEDKGKPCKEEPSTEKSAIVRSSETLETACHYTAPKTRQLHYEVILICLYKILNIT